MNKLSGTLLYVQVNKPVKAFVKPGAEKKPDEWKASVAIVDEDVIDEFEEYAQSIDAKVSLKKVKVADFEDKYKCPVPEGANKYVWVVTFRKSTELGKTGKPVPEAFTPRVLEKQGKAMVDVTYTKLPANGSKGTISIDRFDRNNNTSSLYLKNVLVTEMIEWEGSPNEYNVGQEFEDELDDDDVAENVAPAKPAKETKASKPRGKPVAAKEEVVDEDPPF